MFCCANATATVTLEQLNPTFLARSNKLSRIPPSNMGIGGPASSPYGHGPTTTAPSTMRTRATNYNASASSTKRKRTTAGENDGLAGPEKSTRKWGKNHHGMPLESSVEVVDLTGDEPEDNVMVKKPRRSPRSKKTSEPVPERRARMFRKHPPNTYLQRLERVRTQR